MTRRTLLGALGAVGLACAAPGRLAAQTETAAKRIAVAVDRSTVLSKVPRTFAGLSYESAQLMHPGFFAAGNQELVALVRTLGPAGVLRIGGNTSAFTTWVPGGETTATRDAAGYGPDRGAKATVQTPGLYRITPQAIDNLAGFLRETGWQLLYGLNLRHGTPALAAEEAAYVAGACGSMLLGLQLGNEPDLFRHDDSGDGGKGSLWTYEEFLPQWKAMYAAVHARLPSVPVEGPDSSEGWAERFAAEAHGSVFALTAHYYAGGPPSDPRMTIESLLHPGERLERDVYSALAVAKTYGLPFRMAEANSCYNGGKPGVSDTFASALWAGDLMLDLANRGAVGVNLHGGGVGVYTPIATDSMGQSSARPEYYGLWLAAQFAGGEMVRVDAPEAKAANVTVYAANTGKGLLLAALNKGPQAVRLALSGTPTQGQSTRLSAPSLDSTTGVEFGQGARKVGVAWALEPDSSFAANAAGGGATMLPPGSALLLALS